MTDRISEDLIRIALDKVEGFTFERFVNAFYASLTGATFVPLGGIKDGGADARDGTLYQDSGRRETYYQASIEVDTEGKIRRTVSRLKEFGRDPRTVIYVTSRVVKYSDRVERDLTDELDVTIVIRDGNYIAAHVNDGESTRGAFREYLQQYTDFLKSVGASGLIASSKHVKSPAVYVFLAHEIERRDGDESLVNAVTDALALWALEGTDPDAGILRTAEEILEIIDGELPSVHSLVAPRLQRRLEMMAKKTYSGGRAVKWYKDPNTFCLPYEVRQRLQEENTADESLRLQVLASMDDRLRANPVEGMGEVGIRQSTEVALRAIQLAFEREGLEFSAFLNSEYQAEYATIMDSVRAALQENGLTGAYGQRVGDGAFLILRGVLYDSREVERNYLRRLSRTYALLFTLNTEPRLIEFFQDMSGDFRLYVGADQIIQALSERYLAESDRVTHTTLLMASRLGAKLILPGPVLEEVVHHLRICDFEYQNHIAKVEPYLTYEIARNAPHIMLRAYLYAKMADGNEGQRKPRSWATFIGQFGTYSDLHKQVAFDEIRQYLQVAYGFHYESTEDLEGLVDLQQVDKLTQHLAEVKRDARLARNDALMALAIYGNRKKRRETSRVSEFGYSTWWLTAETAILKYTRDIVSSNGARYVMRPDFLLNFLTLAPTASQARQAFASVFPSLLGIKLARRMHADAFNKIMDTVAEAVDLDDARKTVVISRAIDKLKSDFARQYIDRGTGRRFTGVDFAVARSAKESTKSELESTD
ncbi:hypothetical protein ACFQYP_58705 [Nonomuraea antimicrobica]|uniref:hypothetical protein n=1 Tax=Nonomuraea antimicrobica TaxID=561173 RepID=UPI0031ECA730